MDAPMEQAPSVAAGAKPAVAGAAESAANIGVAAASNIGPAADIGPVVPADLSASADPSKGSPNEVVVPEATGLAARDAVRVVLGAGLLPRLQGSGRLVRQEPPAGSSLPRGATVKLVLEPPS
jgi:cell division protein FtsI (penicillin-binding protein 3)